MGCGGFMSSLNCGRLLLLGRCGMKTLAKYFVQALRMPLYCQSIYPTDADEPSVALG